jgi:uncharacterized protein YbjT (DUF2867 family)
VRSVRDEAGKCSSLQSDCSKACSLTDATVPVRATQFFDFAAMVVGWTRRGQLATVPPLLVQPVAVSDVGDVLVEAAVGGPQNGVRELAGPELQDLVDMAVGRSPRRGRRCG